MAWHPSEFDLALVNSGDLSGWKSYLVRRHLRQCAVCAEQARGYSEVARELRRFGQTLPEAVEGLADRIVAAAPALDAPYAFGAALRLAPVVALLVLVCLAVLLVGQRVSLPDRLDYQASASPEAIVGELTVPHGRQRLVLYTGVRRGPVEVSAGAGALGISYADPDTGAVTITRISLEE